MQSFPRYNRNRKPMIKPFIILALPRSMTAWTANWFNTGVTCTCTHEGATTEADLQRMIDWTKTLEKPTGECSSAIARDLGEALVTHANKFNFGYIKRNEEDALASALKANPYPEYINMELVFEQVAVALNTVLLNVPHKKILFEDMLVEDKFKAFHKALVPTVEFDSYRYSELKDLKVTQDIESLFEREFKGRILK